MPPMDAPRRSPLSSVFIIVLLAIFLLAGALIAAVGIRAVAQHQFFGGGMLLLFGFVFIALTVGFLRLLLIGSREGNQRAKRKAENPKKPWLWREDFATGVIHPRQDAGHSFGIVFSAFWSFCALLAGGLALRQYTQTQDRGLLIALVFPLAGIALLGWSLTNTRRWLRYRRSILQLDSTPVAIGGRMTGAVLIPPRLDPVDGFTVTLDCLRRRFDSHRSPTDTVLWQESKKVMGPASSFPQAATVIPLSIAIPEDCEPWNDEPTDSQVLWRLQVSANVPGPDLDQSFEVPVFRTSLHPAQLRRLPEGFIRAREAGLQPASSRARIESTARGTEFVFPPAGGTSFLGFVVAAAITVVVVWGISKAGAPLIFAVVAGLFGLVPAMALLWAAAGEVHLTLEPDGTGLTYRLLGVHKSWSAAPGEVIEAAISVLGDSRGSRGYIVLLRRAVGAPLYVLTNSRERTEADWIAAEINRRLSQMRVNLHSSSLA